MADDIYAFQASYDQAVAASEALLRVLEENIRVAASVNDNLEVARLEAAKAEVVAPTTGGSVGARSTASVQDTSAALARENELREQGLATELQTLDVIREQATATATATAETQREAAVKRLGLSIDLETLDALKAQTAERAAQLSVVGPAAAGAASDLIVPPATRGFATRGETAGGQLAAAEQEAIARANAASQRLAEAEAADADAFDRQTAAINKQAIEGYRQGAMAAQAGGVVPAPAREGLAGGGEAAAGGWTEADAALVRYNIALGEYAGFAARAGTASAAQTAELREVGVAEADASLSAEALSAQLRGLAIAQEEADAAMRSPGLGQFTSSLARGEATVATYGDKIGELAGRFGTLAAEGGGAIAAIGGAYEIGKGAVSSITSTQQLRRTIPDVNQADASAAIQGVSKGVNVDMKQAGDAVFAFSRVFHNVTDASTAAGIALSAFKLDGVSLTDSVSAMTAIHQQFGVTAKGLGPIFDQLTIGQQQFNARISDQVPLLLKSASAVKLMGGNLHDLITLSTVALRTTSLSGAQVGTAISRSAANFTNPQTTKGQSDLATIKALGVDTYGGHNYTGMLTSAIQKAGTLDNTQRSQLSLAMFGSLRGGLAAGLFTPGAARLLPQVADKESPANAKGALKEELDRELATVGQQLDELANSLQRIGAALAQTGALDGFGVALKLAQAGLNAIDDVITEFDKLPGSAKLVISSLVEMRTAMLLLSKTRVGTRISDATGLSAIGRGGALSRLGFGPSRATRAGQEVAAANAPLIDTYGKSIQSDTVQQTKLKTQQLAAEREQAAIGAQISANQAAIDSDEEEHSALMKAYSAKGAEIAQLQAQVTAIQMDINGQTAAQDALLKENVRMMTSNRATKASDTEKLAAAQKIPGTTAYAAASADANTAAAGAVGAESEANARLAKSEALLADAEKAGIASDAELTAMSEEVTRASRAAALAAKEAAVAQVELAGEVEAAEAAETGLLAGIGGLVTALDPMLAVVIALPIAFELLSHIGGSTNAALSAAQKAAAKPVKTLADLNAHVKALSDVQQIQTHIATQDANAKTKAVASTIEEGLPIPARGGYGVGATPAVLAAARRQAAAVQSGRSTDAGAGSVTAGQYSSLTPDPATEYYKKQTTAQKNASDASADAFYQGGVTALEQDGRNATKTQAGRDAYYAEVKTAAAFKAYAGTHLGENDARDLAAAMQGLKQSEQRTAAGLSAVKVDKSDPFKQFEQLGPSIVEKQVALADDMTKVFGGQGTSSINQAVTAYTYLSNKFNKSTNPTTSDLQAVSTAQTNMVDVIDKQASDMLSSAANATSGAAATGDINNAIATVKHAEQLEEQRTRQIIAQDHGNAKAIKQAQESASQVHALLAGEMTTAVNADIAEVGTKAALATSQIGGSSPEAQVAQAQSALNGLKAQLARAKADNASSDTINGLQTSINDATNALSTQRSSNAVAIVQAQGQLAGAAITGVGPAADMARAKEAITAAKNNLAAVAASGQGPAATMAAQGEVDSALNAYFQQVQSQDQQLQQDAAGAIAANAALAEAQTLSPIKQAQDALKADIETLGTIKRSQYNSEKEYLTARKNQEAKIATDRQSKRSAIITQEEGTLSYELATGKIGDAQYIKGLETILRTKKLSLADRQALRQQIYQLETGDDSSLDLNVGKIKLPSVYAVRRAIGMGKSGAIPGSPATVISHTANVVVNVYGGKANHVGAAIDRSLGTTVKASMRARGVT